MPRECERALRLCNLGELDPRRHLSIRFSISLYTHMDTLTGSQTLKS